MLGSQSAILISKLVTASKQYGYWENEGNNKQIQEFGKKFTTAFHNLQRHVEDLEKTARALCED